MSTTRDAAEDVKAALDILVAVWRIEGLILWEVRDTQLVARRIRDSDEAEAAAGQRAWRGRGSELRTGRTLKAGEIELHPLRGAAQNLVGVVQTPRLSPVRAWRQAIAVVTLQQLAGLLDTPQDDAALFPEVRDPRKRARLLSERTQLINVLDRLRWVFTLAARHLGVTRQTVRNRVERLQIEIPEWRRRPGRPRPAR